MPKLTKEERQQKLLSTLRQGVESITSTAQWQSLLDLRRRLGGYSFRNLMLIFSQFPQATSVAGYRTWQKAGRQVKKGAQGIMICAPCVRKDGDKEDVFFFRTSYVFDISQTEGDELPGYAPPVAQPGGAEVYAALLAVSEGQGIPVSIAQELGAEGRLVYRRQPPHAPRIELHAGLHDAHAASVLAHELAHALLHVGPDGDVHSQAFNEVEAESVAYLVSSELGLDVAQSSFAYIADYQSRDPQDALASGTRILKAADSILAAAKEHLGATHE